MHYLYSTWGTLCSRIERLLLLFFSFFFTPFSLLCHNLYVIYIVNTTPAIYTSNSAFFRIVVLPPFWRQFISVVETPWSSNFLLERVSCQNRYRGMKIYPISLFWDWFKNKIYVYIFQFYFKKANFKNVFSLSFSTLFLNSLFSL